MVDRRSAVGLDRQWFRLHHSHLEGIENDVGIPRGRHFSSEDLVGDSIEIDAALARAVERLERHTFIPIEVDDAVVVLPLERFQIFAAP